MYKCLNCNRVSYDPEIQCDTPTSCNILECATICYASPEGIGVTVGTEQIEITNEQNKKNIVTRKVNLHCKQTENLKFTTVQYAVTCISCLKTLQKEEE